MNPIYPEREALARVIADAILASDVWRNRQAENGSCWDEGPTLPVREGECAPMPPRCELRAGHLGAHRGGRAEWMTRPAARPVITDEMVEQAARALRRGFFHEVIGLPTQAWRYRARAALEAAFGENHQSTDEE